MLENNYCYSLFRAQSDLFIALLEERVRPMLLDQRPAEQASRPSPEQLDQRRPLVFGPHQIGACFEASILQDLRDFEKIIT